MRVALLLHVLAVMFWLGGMAFVHTALRPALTEVLEPPQRLSLLAVILRRFFAAVTLAIVVIFGSGAALIAASPGVATRPTTHAMIGLAVVMTLVFAFIRWRPYPALRSAVASGTWPAGAAAAALIRRLVAFNLLVGIVIIAAVILAA